MDLLEQYKERALNEVLRLMDEDERKALLDSIKREQLSGEMLLAYLKTKKESHEERDRRDI